MKSAVMLLLILLVSTVAIASESRKGLGLTCEDIGWSDVETMVAPYLDDSMQTALVMQGQSSEYNVSEAAAMAMSESLPDVIKRVLKAVVEAECR